MFNSNEKECTIIGVLSVVGMGNNRYARMRINAATTTFAIKGKKVDYEKLKSLLSEAFEKYSYISKENLVTAAVDAWKFQSGIHYIPKEDCVSKLSERRQNQLDKIVDFYYNQTKFIFPAASFEKLLSFKSALSQILSDEYLKGKVYDFSKAFNFEDIPLYSTKKFPNELLRKAIVESCINNFGILPEECCVEYQKFVP